MIPADVILVLLVLAHISGVAAQPLYVDAIDAFREFRNARKIRRERRRYERTLPVARAVPSYWIDNLAHLNAPAVSRRKRQLVIDV